MVRKPQIFSKSRLFRFGITKETRKNLVIKFKGVRNEVNSEDKRPSHWLALLVLIGIVVLQSYYPSSHSKASSQNLITKSSTADWDQGTNSGITTASNEVKISSAPNWLDENYSFRKQVTVTAQASNTVTKGHTLNLAGVGSGSFDGASDQFTLGNNFNNIQLPITVEAWINPKAADGAIFCSDNLNGGAYYGFWMIIDANRKVSINYGDGGGSLLADRRSKVSDTAVTLNTWTHVSAVIRSELDMSIYINGVDAGGAYSGGGGNIVYNNSIDYLARIGMMNAGSPHFKGNIDELRIWSKERSVAEITADMYKEIAAQSNLEGYYKFNQTSGNLSDDSGHNITGTVSGNAAYSPYSNVWGGIDTKALVDAGKIRSDGNDFRLFYGSSEIERELIPATGKSIATSEATQVLFKAQEQIAGGATDNNYSLYYGDSDASDPITSVYDKKMRVKNAYIKPPDLDATNSLQYNANNFPTGGDGTFELWYKWSNPVNKSWATPLFTGNDDNSWQIFYDRSGYRVRFKFGHSEYNPTGTHNNAGEWNHVVMTWHNTATNAQIRVYENNVLTQSDDAATRITKWPDYIKFLDSRSAYDGLEIGLVAAYSNVKDASWVASEFTRNTAVPYAAGRDAAATFIHNFDGNGLDATEANGGYAIGTATAAASNVIMSGDYRIGDTNDERANNSWVSGIYYWFDDFSGNGTKPTPWREAGKINNSSDAVVYTYRFC